MQRDISDFVEQTLLPHLTDQISQLRPVLFTGAGFSVDSRNTLGKPLPSYRELLEMIWPLAEPDQPVHPDANLQDTYYAANQSQANRLKSLLLETFTVNSDSLPDWYFRYMSLAWARCYTLNIDNLDEASQSCWDLPRRIESISATAPHSTIKSPDPNTLQVIHLHGTLRDIPDNVTFSSTQYAQRITRSDLGYSLLVSDILSRPVVFVGSSLDEPSLWSQLVLRGSKGSRDLRELRPRSYLVCPDINPVRERLLSDFNIRWIPMTAEEFSRQILSRLESPSKSALETHLRRYGGPKNRDISEVGSLATNPGRQTEFLLGEEPDWSDIQSGRAVQRECDEDLFALVTNRLNESGRKGIVLVTGTAGTGKSTAMMRVCLRLSASGKRVGWIDRYSDLSSHDIQAFLRTNETLDVLAIDDADARGGGSLSFETKNIVDSSTSPLLLLGLRTTQINHCLNPAVMKGIWQKRFVLPDLSDSDIDKLLDALEAARRLGELTGKTRKEQRRVFRERSSRQLLVAMIEATSGQLFESNVISELTGLEKESASVYALLAVASHFRSGIRLDELLTALGGTSNDLLNEIDSLISNHVVVKRPDGLILTRHRMIATVIFRSLEQSGQLRDVVSGLTFAMATRISPQSRRTSREVKLLQNLVNHDFLLRTIQLDGARQIYSQLEQLLDWSYHYWLQRGSAEVERGELSLADNFLGAARSLKADDLYVNNEYAYLLFRKAIIAPRATESQDLAAQAVSLAGSLIESTRGGSAFPYHVLGSQGLSWSRVGIVDSREKSEFLAMLVKHMESAEKNHPKNAQIAQLANAVKREYLGMAVPVSGKLF